MFHTLFIKRDSKRASHQVPHAIRSKQVCQTEHFGQVPQANSLEPTARDQSKLFFFGQILKRHRDSKCHALFMWKIDRMINIYDRHMKTSWKKQTPPKRQYYSMKTNII